MTRRRNAQHLSVHLLGKPYWRTDLNDGGALESWRALVVALVALEQEASASKVAGLLWPEAPSPKQAFNGNLNRLRDLLDHEICDEASGCLKLKAGVSIDIHRAPEDLPSADDPATLRLLDGIEPIGAVGPWLATQREHWARAVLLQRELRRVGHLERVLRWPEALAAARDAVAAAPELAEAWLAMARCSYLNSDLVGARQALERARGLHPLHAASAGRHLADLTQLIELDSVAAPPRRAFVPASLVRPPKLIGRGNALHAMAAAWSQGQTFVLVGDAGVGKSRLLQEFVARHAGTVLRANGRVGDDVAPYAVLSELLRLALGQTEKDVDNRNDQQTKAALATLFGVKPSTEAALDALAVLETVETVLTRAMSAQYIVVEDLWQADLASIELLRSLASRVPSLRIALTTRPLPPGPRRALVESWVSSEGLTTVDIAAWTEEELAHLLTTVSLPGGASSATPAALLHSTGGVAQLVLWELQRQAGEPEGEFPTELVDSIDGTEQATEALQQAQRLISKVELAARPLLELTAVCELSVHQLAHALECSVEELAAMSESLAALGVLVDGRWAHDLLRDAVLALMPAAALRRWNAIAGALLAPDPTVPRARLAGLWEAAGRWTEAGAALRQAASAALAVGRTDEGRDLLRRAVDCHRRACDRRGEFEALRQSLSLELAAAGPDNVKVLVDRLTELADDATSRARALAAEASRQIWYYRRDTALLDAAKLAYEAAKACNDDDVRAEATLLLAQAMSMTGDSEEALDLAESGLALTRLVCTPRVTRERFHQYSHAVYEAGRLDKAIELTQESLAGFESVGDEASAATERCNLARLLLRTGDPLQAAAQAQSARSRHLRADPSALELPTIANRVALARALAWCGRFREALDELTIDGRLMGATLPPPARGEVQLVHAHMLLLLGDADAACETVGDGEGWPRVMRLQRLSVLARAAEMLGDDAGPYHKGVVELFDPDTREPLPHVVWMDWARHADAREVATRLRSLPERYRRAGMAGMARSATLRRIDGLLKLPERWAHEEAARIAAEVRQDVSHGLQASHYMPEALCTLARALGESSAEGSDCLSEARRWIAAADLPEGFADGFATRNPWNRTVLN